MKLGHPQGEIDKGRMGKTVSLRLWTLGVLFFHSTNTFIQPTVLASYIAPYPLEIYILVGMRV